MALGGIVAFLFLMTGILAKLESRAPGCVE